MTFSAGPVFWILIAMAVVATVVFFERFFELRRARIDFADFVKGVVNVIDRGGDDEALTICEETTAPVAAIVATAVRNRHAPARVLREAVDSQGRAEIGRLDRRLASLAIIGQVAPAVGLFGTFVGFIRTLIVSNSTALVSRPELFAAAIGALVSAAMGLGVAIMVSVMYGMLRIRLDRLVVELEAAASQIVGHIATTEVRK